MKSIKQAASTVILSAALVLSTAVNVASAEQAGTGQEQVFIDLMDSYLDLSRDVVDMASSRETTVFMALEGIVEIYEEQGQKGNAVKHLERIMQTYPGNQIVKNLVRFKLKDLYLELGQTDKALAVLDVIIEENKE